MIKESGLRLPPTPLTTYVLIQPEQWHHQTCDRLVVIILTGYRFPFSDTLLLGRNCGGTVLGIDKDISRRNGYHPTHPLTIVKQILSERPLGSRSRGIYSLALDSLYHNDL